MAYFWRPVRPLHRRAKSARKRPGRAAMALIAAGALLMSVLSAGYLFFRSLTTDLSVSQAQDTAVGTLNRIVSDLTEEGSFERRELIHLSTDSYGSVKSVTANTAALNELCSLLLSRLMASTERRTMDISVPLGNLTGSSFLMNRGPEVPVQVVLLSSTNAQPRSEVLSAGLSLTRHRVVIDVTLSMAILMPWRVVETEIKSEIPVAETIIMGDVPGTYINYDYSNTEK